MTITPTAERWWSPIGQADSDVVGLHIDLRPHQAREAEAFAWLDERERARCRRFVSPEPRRRFTLCRAALRALLCDQFNCSNEQLAFGTSYYEKPFAIVRGLPSPVSFNVSHSGKHGLIAFAHEGRLGIDLEECIPRRNLEILIETALTPTEQADIAPLAGSHRLRIFFKFWTVKEALVKAVGTGLSLDVSTFEVPLAMRRGANTATFRFPQVPSVHWQVESIDSEEFIAATAHELGSTSSLSTSGLNRHSLYDPAS